MRSSIALLPILGFAGASGAWAAELNLNDMKPSPAPAPSWGIVGSVSPTFTDNALFSRNNRKSDFYYEPDLSVRLDGYLTNGLSYRLYARGQFEALAIEKGGNFAIARFGGAFDAELGRLALLGHP